jgi:hypothetical protein
VIEIVSDEPKQLLKKSLLDSSSIGDEDAAMKLLDLLTHLLLAIKQATAYTNENAISVSDYL